MNNTRKKKSKSTMTLSENLLWITVILFAILIYYKDNVYSLILVFWTINLVAIGNAKRVYSEKYYTITTFIRKSIYAVPLLIPLCVGFKFNFSSAGFSIYIWIAIGLLIGIILILPKCSEWRIVLSKDMILFSKKNSKYEYIASALLVIFVPICEEYFFRNFLITETASSIKIFSIFLSSYLFLLHHFSCKWASNFSRYDFVIQFIFGLISGTMFYYSRSAIPCIIAHLVYNSPHLVLVIKSYYYFYINTTND